MGLAWIDALVFTSVWVAAVAGALCAASALAMGAQPPLDAMGLAAAGTLVVYNIDRLRDLQRDFATTPERSAFIARHAAALRALTVVSVLAAAGFVFSMGWRVVALLAPVLLLGLFHRRLKYIPFSKPAYITFAWVVVVVGLPVLVAERVENVFTVVCVNSLSIAANIIASNLRADETAEHVLPPAVSLRIARGLAAIGVVVALSDGPSIRPLALVPLLTAGALLRRDIGERYGMVVVDGALLAGAVGAIALS